MLAQKVGRLPELYSGSMSDSPVVGPIFRPAFLTGSGYSDTMIPSFLPDVIDPTTPPAPNMALPDGSAIPSDIQPAGNINKYIEDTFPTDESRDLSPSLYPNELKFFETPKAAPAVDRPSNIQLEMAQPTSSGLTAAPRTTAASEAARRSMSDAPLGGDDALINPLPYTEYGLSRSSGVDAEARRLAQGILAGDNQLNEGGMYPKARDALDNAAKTAAFATQGMTPGTPEYLSTLIETADAASMAGDVPSQVLPSTGLTSDPTDPNAGYNPPVVAPS